MKKFKTSCIQKVQVNLLDGHVGYVDVTTSLLIEADDEMMAQCIATRIAEDRGFNLHHNYKAVKEVGCFTTWNGLNVPIAVGNTVNLVDCQFLDAEIEAVGHHGSFDVRWVDTDNMELVQIYHPELSKRVTIDSRCIYAVYDNE